MNTTRFILIKAILNGKQSNPTTFTKNELIPVIKEYLPAISQPYSDTKMLEQLLRDISNAYIKTDNQYITLFPQINVADKIIVYYTENIEQYNITADIVFYS